MTRPTCPHLMHLFDPEPYTLAPAKRWPCPCCGRMPLPIPGLEEWPELGADPCLGWLPDVAAACCGHGFSGDPDPWDQTEDGRRPHTSVAELPEHVILHGDNALAFFRSLGVGPP